MDFTKIFEDLNISFPLIGVNMVGLVVLYFIANKLVFTPIGKVLTERGQDIATTYDKMDADTKEMKRLKSDYETRLASIEAEAREKINSAVLEAQTLRDQIISKANEQSREIVTRAEAEAEREREQAMITLRQQIVDLAMGATHKVIGDTLDQTKQRSLIDEFITQSVAKA
jgi:F-type H+-transporting ATPase subunit b